MDYIASLFDAATIWKLIQISFIDLVLSGDNAIIIGTILAGLAASQRRVAWFGGIALALVLRIIFSLGVNFLESLPGLVIAGGVALLWVAYGMAEALLFPEGDEEGHAPAQSIWAALWSVTIADVSMSIDNVLGVSGAAGDHRGALIFGLVLSVALMAGASGAIAKLIGRFAWIAWIGLGMILFVAGKMIIQGAPQLDAYLAAHADWVQAHGIGFLSGPIVAGILVIGLAAFVALKHFGKNDEATGASAT